MATQFVVVLTTEWLPSKRTMEHKYACPEINIGHLWENAKWLFLENQ